MVPDFDPGKAFNTEFMNELDEYPEDAKWTSTGRASKDYPNGENLDWWLTHGPQMVKRWMDWREATPWDVWVTPDGQPAIELGLELEIRGEYTKLFIDRVFATGPDNTRPIVVDIKAGSMPPKWWFQLGLYKVALETQWPQVKVAGGTFWLARSGETTGIRSLDWCTPELTASYMRQLRIARAGRVFLPNVGSFCKSCKVGRFCAANGGAESHLDPDHQLMG